MSTPIETLAREVAENCPLGTANYKPAIEQAVLSALTALAESKDAEIARLTKERDEAIAVNKSLFKTALDNEAKYKSDIAALKRVMEVTT